MESATAVPSATLNNRARAGGDADVSAPIPIVVKTPYEHRLELVSDVLTRNSVTTTAEATRLAIQVLHAVDHIPERVR